MKLRPDDIAREVKSVRLNFERLGRPVTDAMETELVGDFVSWSSRAQELHPGESAIVTLLRPKTSALAVDRVYLPFAGEHDGLSFGFCWESRMAVRFAAMWAFLALTEGFEDLEDTDVLDADGASFVDFTERGLSEEYAQRVAARVTPLFASVATRDLQYQPGNWPVVISVIDNLAVVNEKSLKWEQVLEFRGDADARTAYRRFIHWLDSEMAGRSREFIVDEIAARGERYQWALRKHGIETVLGSFSSTLDAQQLIGSAATALTVQSLAQQPLLAALSGAGVLVGKACVSLAAAAIQRADIRASQQDIAYVHQLKRELGKP